MTQPQVTVLMPVYNGEKYLQEAIESILRQTMTEFEFLIIDDGSSDKSVDIIQSYRDRRIKLIRNETNMGISASLNRGITLAAGELIARMDADDISYPERLEKQYAYIQKNKDCRLLSTWARIISEDGRPIRTETYDSRFYYYNLTFSCWIYHPTVMCSKKSMIEAGGYRCRYGEDYDLFWHMMRNFKIGNIEEALVDYRISPQSLHQVVRKKEYDQAVEEQIIRNINFYTGGLVPLSWEELQCLRFNIVPLIKLNNLGAILKTFRKLNKITQHILDFPNPNLVADDVIKAWAFRKKYIASDILKRMGPINSLILKIALRGIASPRSLSKTGKPSVRAAVGQ